MKFGVNENGEAIETLEKEKKKPVIKGYPELRWTGKRPFNGGTFYPAQLKETYGNANGGGWLNKIFWGDNLQVMGHLLKEYRGKIDLIYIDPPFDSKADYKMKIKLKGNEVLNDNNAFESKQYGDIWTNDEYLQFMYERLKVMWELLSDTGSIILHCDWRKSAHLRCILDEVFGISNFRNEIIWENQGSWIESDRYFPRRHNSLFFYSKTDNYKFNPLNDDDISVGVNYNRWYDYIIDNRIFGKNAPTHDARFKPYLEKFIKEHGRKPKDNDIIVEFKGSLIGSVWYIKVVDPKSPENENYPTQKPEKLIYRFINSLTNPGDIVFDCFMGSGTTQAVAMKLGRRFIGADINLGSIQTTTKRLLNIQKELKGNSETKGKYYTGFEVYNVNNYDFFRNPVEARDLLIEALGIQKYSGTNVFDGELDGRNVKILPVNRIATKADLSELVANLPYKAYEKSMDENPSVPVDSITLVCMGHEPELKAALQQMVGKYKLDIDIVDILKDKKDLELKREAVGLAMYYEKDGKTYVEISDFYPMNLCQKLSLQGSDIEDYRQLVDSIMIDYNYDGEVLKPEIVDVPDKKEMVKGIYEIPKDHGVIRIKITDLLSESIEIEASEYDGSKHSVMGKKNGKKTSKK